MMNRNEILKADLDDIVFAGRNQEYGAYVLRKKYDRQIVRSAIWGTLILLLLVFYPAIASSLQNLLNTEDEDELLMKEVVLTEPPPLDPNLPPPPPPPPPAAPPPKASIRFVPPVVKKDEEVVEEEEEVIPPDIPDDVQIADKTQEGERTTDLVEPEPEAPVEAVVEAPVEDVKVYTFVEQQPEYPEGTAALMKWIGSNLSYPAIARENGIEGTVYVGFVVEKDGSITDVQVKRGVVGGKVLDDEAVRVVKKMPAWKPGKQNGRAVRVLFTLPVKFKLS